MIRSNRLLVKPSRRNWFRYIFYLSLLFLMIALARAEYLNIPNIFNYSELVFSILLLFAGFLLNALSWSVQVGQAGFRTSFADGIISAGLSVFAKYIPGKVWVIMGRAEFLAKKYSLSRKDMGSLSLDAQFVALWVALLLGATGMVAIKSTGLYGLSVLVLFLLLSLLIFTPVFHNPAEWLLTRFTGKKTILLRLPFSRLLRVILFYFLNWSTWCLAFYFFANSLSEQTLPFTISFGFGLAGSLGIMAIFAPGGLGVREGILTGYMVLAGIDVQTATTIAIASRLWFLLGEVFLFLFSVILERRKN